jgi:mono/diheme cytochrome c family protein
MSISFRSMTGLVSALCLAAGVAHAQSSEYGEALFNKNCAVCHGAQGKGDGPVSMLFRDQPRNLRILAAENNGAFPFSEVYQAIDGRRNIDGHGTTAMPVWGALFEAEALPQTFHPGVEAKEIVQTRILALVYYLQSIQQ